MRKKMGSKQRRAKLFGLALCCLALCIPVPAPAEDDFEMKPEAVPTFLANHQDACIIDLRTQREFSVTHLPGATNIPASDLVDRLGEIPTGRPILIYDAIGIRSAHAARLLQEKRPDLTSVHIINGRPLFPEVN